MLRDCPPETRLGRAAGADRVRPHRRSPERAHPDVGHRRDRRHPHAARAGAPDREADPGRAARGVPGRRAHADARTRRRARPPDRRLRPRGRCGRDPARSPRTAPSTSRADAVPMFAIPIAGLRVGHWTGDGHRRHRGAPARRHGRRRARCAAARPRRASSRCSSRRARSRASTRSCSSGGSAFGLATADGVMRFLAERGQGFPTAGGPVPIVPAACVFDLVESGGRRPAPTTATRPPRRPRARRRRPAGWAPGAGATVGKWRGREHAVAGGFGVAAGALRRRPRGRVRRGERGR